MELGLRFDLEKLVKSLRRFLLSQKSNFGCTSTFLTKTCQEFARIFVRLKYRFVSLGYSKSYATKTNLAYFFTKVLQNVNICAKI